MFQCRSLDRPLRAGASKSRAIKSLPRPEPRPLFRCPRWAPGGCQQAHNLQSRPLIRPATTTAGAGGGTQFGMGSCSRGKQPPSRLPRMVRITEEYQALVPPVAGTRVSWRREGANECHVVVHAFFCYRWPSASPSNGSTPLLSHPNPQTYIGYLTPSDPPSGPVSFPFPFPSSSPFGLGIFWVLCFRGWTFLLSQHSPHPPHPPHSEPPIRSLLENALLYPPPLGARRLGPCRTDLPRCQHGSCQARGRRQHLRVLHPAGGQGPAEPDGVISTHLRP